VFGRWDGNVDPTASGVQIGLTTSCSNESTPCDIGHDDGRAFWWCTAAIDHTRRQERGTCAWPNNRRQLWLQAAVRRAITSLPVSAVKAMVADDVSYNGGCFDARPNVVDANSPHPTTNVARQSRMQDLGWVRHHRQQQQQQQGHATEQRERINSSQ
jgi:hypothetical protein